MVSSINIRKGKEEIWSNANKLAKALGMNRSEMIVEILEEVLSNEKARLLIAECPVNVSERSRSLLHDVLNAQPTAA